MTNKKFKIYKLTDPISKEIRYIGYTSLSIEKRLKSHIYDCKSRTNHKTTWIKSLLKKGLKPIIEEIDSRDTLEEILKLEVEYISKYSNLTNSTSGGETNKIYCESVRHKISKVLSDGRMNGSKNPMYGKKRPKLGEMNKKRIWKDETKIKMSIEKKKVIQYSRIFRKT